MGQPLLSAPNWVDGTFYPVAFSGGSWLPSLPLTNLKNPRFYYKTRSANAFAASTQFMVDLGTLRGIKATSIPQSNVSRVGVVRVRYYLTTDPASIVADSGYRDYWRTMYTWGSLPFEHPSWLDGKITEEERAGYPMPFVHVLESSVIARYVQVEIVDEENEDGYIDLPRLYICPGWEPSTGIQVGARIGYTDPSQEDESLGSILFFDERPGYRTTSITIPFLPYNETFSTAWELIRQLKRTKEMFFSIDPSDDTNLHRWSFPATCREVPQIEFSDELYQTITFELREVVG